MCVCILGTLADDQRNKYSLTKWGTSLWLIAVFVWPSPGSRPLSSIASLESPVVCCLGPLIHYLTEFNLQRVLLHHRYSHTYTHTTLVVATDWLPVTLVILYVVNLCVCVTLSSFRHLSCESDGMVLSAPTLRNLEILTNQVRVSEWVVAPLKVLWLCCGT